MKRTAKNMRYAGLINNKIGLRKYSGLPKIRGVRCLSAAEVAAFQRGITKVLERKR